MEILFWVVVGIVAGALAKALVPGTGPAGILGDLAVGVIGAFLGGWLFRMMGYAGAETYSWLWTTFVAFIGAVVLLVLMRMVTHHGNA